MCSIGGSEQRDKRNLESAVAQKTLSSAIGDVAIELFCDKKAFFFRELLLFFIWVPTIEPSGRPIVNALRIVIQSIFYFSYHAFLSRFS